MAAEGAFGARKGSLTVNFLKIDVEGFEPVWPLSCIVMAYIVMACIGMACIVMACIGMAYVVVS